MSSLGCASPLLSSYQHEKSVHCRVDNPDRDSLWDTSDENGNGVIDDNEAVGPVFDLASLGGPLSGEQVSFLPTAIQLTGIPQPRQPAFEEDFNGVAGLSIATGGDGVSDNLDGISGFVPVFGIGQDGTNVLVGQAAAFDDFYTFNIAFERAFAGTYTESYGMQVSRTHRFTKKGQKTDPSTNFFEFAYGARHLRLEETFFFGATGSILGLTTVDMSYNNRLLGPQVGFNWQRQRGNWTLRGGSNLMLGYNFAKAHQRGIVGESLTPGAIRRVTAQPNIVASAREHEELASIAELSAAASYQVLRNVAFQLGYRALYLSELRHAGESIDFSLPNLGILDQGDSNAWLEGLHASVEWRR